MVFARSAQEYQRMPKVIKFEERYAQIRSLLADFDYKAVTKMDENELYKTFREKFEVTSRDSKSNSWYKWSCAIIDSARFINGFDGFEDFQRFVDRFDYNTETRMALPLLISCHPADYKLPLPSDCLGLNVGADTVPLKVTGSFPSYSGNQKRSQTHVTVNGSI